MQAHGKPTHPSLRVGMEALNLQPSLRFCISEDITEAELERRENYEKMLSGAPKRLLGIDNMHAIMQKKGFFYVQTHLDATVEYMHESEAETVFYFQRDWTKRGLLNTPYRVSVYEPGDGKYFYRVRCIKHLSRVLAFWAARHE
jgi:hypothetical protein